MASGNTRSKQPVALKRVATVQSGATIGDDDLRDGPIRVFGANGPIGYTHRSNTHGPAIIVGRSNTRQNIYWTDAPCWANAATFFIDETLPQLDLRWLYYALQTLEFDDETITNNLARQQLADMRLHLPDIRVQKQDVQFLDAAIAQLTQILSEKQALLALCAEKRRTLINQATAGLNEDVPRKASSSTWPGSIPANWRTVPLKRLIRTIVTGPNLTTTNHRAKTGEFGALMSAAIKAGHFDARKNHALLTSADFQAGLSIESGDLFISRTGEVALADADYPNLTFSSNLFRLRVDSHHVLAQWVLWVLLGDVGRIQIEAGKNTGEQRPNLNQSDILGWLIPLPPLPEQRALVSKIEAEVATLDALAQATRQSIDLLHERHTLLLAQAISGQLNVKETAT